MKTVRYLMGLVAAMAFSTVALADQVRTVGYYGPYQTGKGGEFTFQIVNDDASPNLDTYYTYYATDTKDQYLGPIPVNPATPNFQSFCVEGSETISPNTLYDVTIGQWTQYGGSGGPKQLSKGAAWLYMKFADENLAGYNYSGARTTSADQLQKAIWWLMGDQQGQTLAKMILTSNPYYMAVTNRFGSAAAALAPNNNAYDVAILNLWVVGHPNGDKKYAKQDQLILTGKGNDIPDGGLTVAMLGIALTGLATVGRRIRK